MAHVGGRVRSLRTERHMTLEDLGEKSGLSKGLLSKLENQVEANPSLETLHKVAQALDVTVGDLVESEAIIAKRIIPAKQPAWIGAVLKALEQEGKAPDEDILQALYVLQSRKGNAQRSDQAWVHMYRSLELNFSKGRP